MKRYRFLAVTARYWKPNEDYLGEIETSLGGRVRNGDIVVVSEKALATAMGNLVDESLVKPSFLARCLARFWMRYVWAYFLGRLCRLRKKTIEHLRNYPLKEGSAHKQVALQRCSFLEALMYGSEGGIDGSNLPYFYVSLPLKNAHLTAETIRDTIEEKLETNVTVMIVDTDKTYSWRNLHITHRPQPIKGIHSAGGFLNYVFGRAFKLRNRATPLAVVGTKISVEEALNLAESANLTRGFGAGRTLWDMAKHFGVSLTDVSWEMLEEVEHKPLVIAKLIDSEKR